MLTIPVARHVRGSLEKLQRSCFLGNFVNSQNSEHRKSHGVPFNSQNLEHRKSHGVLQNTGKSMNWMASEIVEDEQLCLM